MSQNLSVLRLQKYGFFHYRQLFCAEFFKILYNLLIIKQKFFV
jgi:hypothetical protein